MSKALATKNVAAVLVATAMVFGFAFAFATPAKADMLSDLQAQVQALLAQIASLQGGSTGGSMTGGSCTTFTQNLKPGSTGGEVMAVQKFLNSNGFQVAATGAGSPGNETSTFGPATKAAVMKFQNMYAADILTPVGLTAGTGNWFAATRAKANAMCVGGGTTVTPPGTPPSTIPSTGGSLMVGAASQPANSLAPKGTSRVPFTTFTLTNTSGAAVTVNNVTVQRTGLGQDAAFAGVILVDEMGVQLGNSRTLNSNHQVNAGDAFVINPGQTKTITVMGNMASSLTSYAGQVVSLSVIGINTNGSVSGVLPISGASHTLNDTLTIGTLQTTQGSSDLDAAQTSQSIGETGKIGASIRLTAGSAEDVWVKSMRFNQSGSASQTDISNVVLSVDGTSYPMTVSSDGKYYWVTFPGNGIQIMKGLSKEATVKFDIVNGSNRTVNFDIYKGTDIYAVGGTYGYGINPSQNGTCATSVTTATEFVAPDTTCSSGTPSTPYFSGSQFTIAAGSANSYARASEVAAQNIAVAAPNQPLGGFAFDVKGEPIQVQSHVFFFQYGSGDDGELLTSVRMVDKNGVVVAGPVDAVLVARNQSKVTFTDTVTYPTGRNVYTLQGQLPSTISNGQTVIASTTPSTNWTNVTGQSTGDTVSLSALSTAVSGNTMTVKTGSVVVSVAGTPSAQSMVAGVTGATVAAFVFDASASGEDVRFNSQKFDWTESGMTAGDITNCFAFDGATRLNDSAVNPSTSGDGYTFTFNTVLTVTKGGTKTVTIKCDIPGAVTSGATFSWGFITGEMAQGTGMSSSNAVTPSGSDNAGNTMTVAGAGTLTVALDATAPSAKVVAVGTAGATGVTLNAIRFNGTNEDMRLDKVGLILTGGSASSSPSNITQVTLWDGATQVGSAVFAGQRYATSTLSGTVIVPANGSKTLTIKGDLPGISANSAGTGGALLQVNYDNDNGTLTGTRAVGMSSGSTIYTTSSDTAVAGTYVQRSVPLITYVATPGALTNGTQPLVTVTIAADAKGDVTMRKLTFTMSTTSAALTAPTFVGPNGSVGTVAVTNGGTGNLLTITFDSGSNTADAVIPMGGSKQYTLGATVAGLTGSTAGVASFSLKADGSISGSPALAANVAPASMIWSPQSTTTAPSATATYDWFNGYGLGGCFAATGIGQDCLAVSKAQ